MRWCAYILMKKWYLILLLFLTVHCREEYNVVLRTNGNGVLVVEGIMNARGKTKISLSRTTRLADKRIAAEVGAFLFIEGENNGAVYPLIETQQGVYESGDNVFDAATKYKLRIRTADNREYETDYKSFLVTPPVDSLSWRQTPAGLDIFSNAKSEGDVKYYKLDYDETWEFHSAYRTLLGFKETSPGSGVYQVVYLDPVTQSVDTTLFVCYNSRSSSNINLVSTEALDSNIVFTPVKTYTRGAIELSVLYSILVKQYGLSKEGYEFYVKMKKNTESLGSIFDAQPSEISGNVKCITDPSELVIGYVEFTTIEEKRLFIDNRDLNDWGYEQDCQYYFSNPHPNDADVILQLVKERLVPTVVAKYTMGGGIEKFDVQKEQCVDCRLRGSNIKPDFWP